MYIVYKFYNKIMQFIVNIIKMVLKNLNFIHHFNPFGKEIFLGIHVYIQI